MTLYDGLLALVANSHDSAWDEFRFAKQKALDHGLPAIAATKWKGPGEPAFVAQLVSDSTLWELRDLLRENLPSQVCSGDPLISTAFIHQKPKVQFGSSEVELGDLLLVRHHFAYGIVNPQGRALLLQAKAGLSARTGGLKGNEADQFHLYKHWPPIKFPYGEIGDPPDGSPEWNFKKGPSRDTDSGCYGLVYERELPLPPPTKRRASFPEDCPWSVGLHQHFRAASVDASKVSLASLLTGFIHGTQGRPFEAVPNPGDHWSSFIHTILRNAAGAKWRYRVQRIDIEGRDRLQRVAALASKMPALAFAVTATLGPDRLWPVRSRYRSLAEWVDRTMGLEGPPGNVPDWIEVSGNGGGLQLLYVATFGTERLPD